VWISPGRRCDEGNPWLGFPVVIYFLALLVSQGGTLPAEKVMPLVALVVDDSMLIRHTVCRFLEERGFSVESATNGQEALDALKRRRPDIIITDMDMPKMTGSELITALKSHPDTAKIPVVIVAGKQSGFDEKEQRANFAIFKDIDIEDQLAKALQSAINLPAAKGQAAGK
jgi:CheY-like chemotaxis protein